MPKLIRNTYAGFVSSNPILALEDTGFERDTGRSKIGDGVTAWNDLNYFNEVPAGGGVVSPLQIYQRSDDFSGDMSKWVADVGVLPTAGTGFAVPSSVNAYIMHLVELSPADVYVVAKFIPKHLDNAMAVVARGKSHAVHADDQPRLQAQHHLGALRLYYYNGVGYTELAVDTASSRVVNQPEWVVCKCEGNEAVAEVWTTDPANGGVPQDSLSVILTAAQMTELGSGEGFAGISNGGTAPIAYVDEFKVAGLASTVRSQNGTAYYWGVNDDGQIATIPV